MEKVIVFQFQKMRDNRKVPFPTIEDGPEISFELMLNIHRLIMTRMER